jgi:glycosyltransferase involved in cell wall biosynthesis
MPDARFWLLGVPMHHHESDRLVVQSVLDRAQDVPNLEILAPRAHSEVQSLLNRAVASVNTAEYEGMPNVLLEAWTRGVPALVLYHDPDEVVSRYGLGGFAHGSAEELIMLARHQWETRGARTEVSERCRAYIQQHHNPESVAEQWRQVILGRKQPVAELVVPEAQTSCAA